jgi:hypothetical protein
VCVSLSPSFPSLSGDSLFSSSNSEEIEEGGDTERIASLTAKVAALERQLKSTSSSTNNHLPPNAPVRLSSESSRPSPSSSGVPTSDNSLASVSSTLNLVWGSKLQLTAQQHETVKSFLMGHAVTNADVGRTSVTWQMGEKGMAMALMRHLLDGSSSFFYSLSFQN